MLLTRSSKLVYFVVPVLLCEVLVSHGGSPVGNASGSSPSYPSSADVVEDGYVEDSEGSQSEKGSHFGLMDQVDDSESDTDSSSNSDVENDKDDVGSDGFIINPRKFKSMDGVQNGGDRGVDRGSEENTSHNDTTGDVNDMFETIDSGDVDLTSASNNSISTNNTNDQVRNNDKSKLVNDENNDDLKASDAGSEETETGGESAHEFDAADDTDTSNESISYSDYYRDNAENSTYDYYSDDDVSDYDGFIDYEYYEYSDDEYDDEYDYYDNEEMPEAIAKSGEEHTDIIEDERNVYLFLHSQENESTNSILIDPNISSEVILKAYWKAKLMKKEKTSGNDNGDVRDGHHISIHDAPMDDDEGFDLNLESILRLLGYSTDEGEESDGDGENETQSEKGMDGDDEEDRVIGPPIDLEYTPDVPNDTNILKIQNDVELSDEDLVNLSGNPPTDDNGDIGDAEPTNNTTDGSGRSKGNDGKLTTSVPPRKETDEKKEENYLSPTNHTSDDEGDHSSVSPEVPYITIFYNIHFNNSFIDLINEEISFEEESEESSNALNAPDIVLHGNVSGYDDYDVLQENVTVNTPYSVTTEINVESTNNTPSYDLLEENNNTWATGVFEEETDTTTNSEERQNITDVETPEANENSSSNFSKIFERILNSELLTPEEEKDLQSLERLRRAVEAESIGNIDDAAERQLVAHRIVRRQIRGTEACGIFSRRRRRDVTMLHLASTPEKKGRIRGRRGVSNVGKRLENDNAGYKQLYNQYKNTCNFLAMAIFDK